MGHRPVLLVMGVLGLAVACSGGGDDAVVATSAATTTAATTSTGDPPTSSTTTATTAATTAAPAVTSTTAPDVLGDGDLVLVVDGEIVEWRTADAAYGDLVSDEFSDFVAHDLELAADRTSVFVGVAYDDSWYSCDGILGTVERVDMATGASEQVSSGTRPRLDPSGRHLAVLDTKSCRPDPASTGAPTYIADVDTVRLFDLETGVATEQTIGGAATPPAVIRDHLWLPDGRYAYLTSTGRLVTTDLVAGATLDQPGVELPSLAEPSVSVSLAGVDRSGLLVAVVGTGPPKLATFDPATGEEVATLATLTGPDAWAELDGGGRLLVGDEGALTVDGTPAGVPPVNEYGSGYVLAADG